MASRKLRKGFTTGAAAAAAVKAALISFFSQDPKSVEIQFLTGEKKLIAIKAIKKITENRCEAIVIKDAGDDPDITHKAEIGARVTLSDSDEFVINIIGGKGVGTITKPGLELPVGEPAINPGPRRMIQNSVEDVFARFNIKHKQVDIEIFVPKGEALAKKTLNARLGILGGISILGTTGIVTPMSHDAYIATIKSGISVAAAKGLDTLVFTTGRRSERFAMEIFKPFGEEAFIQTGDFFKASLDMALLNPRIQAIVYTIFFGKAVKMALGFEHTHAAKSELTLKKLAGWAADITGNRELERFIAEANTARHAFSFIYPQYPELISHVGKKIQENACRFSDQKLEIRVLILDFDGKIAFDTNLEGKSSRKKYGSDAKIILNRLGRLSGFLTDLDADASKEDCFNFPLEIIRKTMMFDVSVLYKVSNIIENRLILEVVKILDPKNLRSDLKEGRKLRLFLDNRDKKFINEVTAFLNKRTSYLNVSGMGCDIIGYVYLPESFGGAYLFGGDFFGKEAAIKDHEVACIDIMCNFLSAILLKTQFEQQAEYDNLTGLFNSGKIKQKVETIIKRFERKPGSSACIAMGDIDFFKKINDLYGHIQGDLVLKKMGEILSNSMRGVFDVAGRYGGEEFLLILDETDEANAFQIIERLRKNIEKTKFEKTEETKKIMGNKFLKLTMSFGISTLSRDSDIKTATEWISQADKALYEAKQSGKNTTIVFKGE